MSITLTLTVTLVLNHSPDSQLNSVDAGVMWTPTRCHTPQCSHQSCHYCTTKTIAYMKPSLTHLPWYTHFRRFSVNLCVSVLSEIISLIFSHAATSTHNTLSFSTDVFASFHYVQREDSIFPIMYEAMIDLLVVLFGRVLNPEIVGLFSLATSSDLCWPGLKWGQSVAWWWHILEFHCPCQSSRASRWRLDKSKGAWWLSYCSLSFPCARGLVCT